jgi:hypothetical protein
MSLSLSSHDIYQLSDDEEDEEQQQQQQQQQKSQIISSSSSSTSHSHNHISHHPPIADVNEYDMISYQHDIEHKYDESQQQQQQQQDNEQNDNTYQDPSDDIIPITTHDISSSPSSESSIGSPITSAVLGIDMDYSNHPFLSSTPSSDHKSKRESNGSKKKAASRYFSEPDISFKVIQGEERRRRDETRQDDAGDHDMEWLGSHR